MILGGNYITYFIGQIFAHYGLNLKDNQFLACYKMLQLQTDLIHKHQGTFVFRKLFADFCNNVQI